jgi:iron(III) transport system substrate-binding protein
MRLTSFVALASAIFIASPSLADKVNIYSQRQPELVQPLIDAYVAKTGTTINISYINKGLPERLVAEGKRSPADVVLTVDISRLTQLADMGVTQAVKSEVISANIPAAFRDQNNQWFGLTSRARAVFASKERVQNGDVTTYEGLADPKWKGRLCTRSGLHDYNLALLSAVIAHDGLAKATHWAKGLKANLAKKPAGGDRDQVKAIWAGECDIALGNTYYMGEMLADPKQSEWANAVSIIFPTFSDRGTHLNISGMALTQSAPNKAEALRFMEWLNTDTAQQIYAQTNHEFPLKNGVARSILVKSWGPFTADTLPLTEVFSHRADALSIMQTINYDGQ